MLQEPRGATAEPSAINSHFLSQNLPCFLPCQLLQGPIAIIYVALSFTDTRAELLAARKKRIKNYCHFYQRFNCKTSAVTRGCPKEPNWGTSAFAFLPAGVEFCIPNAHLSQDTKISSDAPTDTKLPCSISLLGSVPQLLLLQQQELRVMWPKHIFLAPPSLSLVILIFHTPLPVAFPCPTQKLTPSLWEWML